MYSIYAPWKAIQVEIEWQKSKAIASSVLISNFKQFHKFYRAMTFLKINTTAQYTVRN